MHDDIEASQVAEAAAQRSFPFRRGATMGRPSLDKSRRTREALRIDGAEIKLQAVLLFEDEIDHGTPRKTLTRAMMNGGG